MKNCALVTNPKPIELSSYLKESLISFSTITKVPVTFFDSQGVIQWECGLNNKVCKFFDIYQNPNSICRANLNSAALFSTQLGEPYIFVCKAGLINIAVSLIIDGNNIGCFIAGPFIMGSLKESTVNKFLTLNKISDQLYAKLTIFLSNILTFSPKDVSHLAILLNNCVMSSINTNKDYLNLSKQYKDQTKIGIDIQKNKKEKKLMKYPYELENNLVHLVKCGDSQGAQSTLKLLLNEIFLLEFGDFTLIKSNVMNIFSIISRSILNEKSYLFEFIETDIDAIETINSSQNFDELIINSCNLVNDLSSKIGLSIYNGKSNVIKNALRYINENYTRKISLKDIEDNLHVNQSYFSMLFKQEMGVTFIEYLNLIRIRQAKLLLSNSNMSIVNISLETGFEDQSYFTKVFKKKEGISPKEYRNNNLQGSLTT